MKKKLALVLTAIMTLCMTACGAKSTDTLVEVNGETVVADSDVVNTGENEEENTEGGSTAEYETDSAKLGVKSTAFELFNPNGTNTDKIAMTGKTGGTVLVLHFGEGSNVVSGLGINEIGLFGTLEADPEIGFAVTGAYDGLPDFILMTSTFDVEVSDAERAYEVTIYDGYESFVAEDGSYTLRWNPENEGYYTAFVTLKDSEAMLSFTYDECETLDEAKLVTEYLRDNMECYSIKGHDITAVTDVNRQPVDISDCIFYNDLLLKQLNEKYGFIVKNSEVIYHFNKDNFMLYDDWNWELQFNYDLNWVDGLEEMETASFLGYKAYVIPGECIALQYGEEKCIYIELNTTMEEKTTEAMLSALEEQFFTE